MRFFIMPACFLYPCFIQKRHQSFKVPAVFAFRKRIEVFRSRSRPLISEDKQLIVVPLHQDINHGKDQVKIVLRIVNIPRRTDLVIKQGFFFRKKAERFPDRPVSLQLIQDPDRCAVNEMPLFVQYLISQVQPRFKRQEQVFISLNAKVLQLFIRSLQIIQKRPFPPSNCRKSSSPCRVWKEIVSAK